MRRRALLAFIGSMLVATKATASVPRHFRQTGSASWYGVTRHPKPTASGERYDPMAMTAAHGWLPFGSHVNVTRRDTGRSIIVTINDRLPPGKHIIDLSVKAAGKLGILLDGTTAVRLTLT